ncbi:hypothetical protein [Streptomyces sp. NBC_01244]|uniref:hypothetical protein n=1 Tax=Streptomyces sp. NBC_01244 TaxID=2903797 RepID=UPI003FA3479B
MADSTTPRLICVAEDFTRYDVLAVREIRRSIDLVRYGCFGSDLMALDGGVRRRWRSGAKRPPAGGRRRWTARRQPVECLVPEPAVVDLGGAR